MSPSPPVPQKPRRPVRTVAPAASSTVRKLFQDEAELPMARRSLPQLLPRGETVVTKTASLPSLGAGGRASMPSSRSRCTLLPSLSFSRGKVKSEAAAAACASSSGGKGSGYDDEFREAAALSAAARKQSEILEHTRQVIEACTPQLEAAEKELDAGGDALNECREGLDACGRMLRSTSYRLEERGVQLAALDCSPEVRRMNSKAREVSRDVQEISRRTLLMQAEMSAAKRQFSAEALGRNSGFASPSPNGGRRLERSPLSAAPDDSAWDPRECLKRRSTTKLLAF